MDTITSLLASEVLATEQKLSKRIDRGDTQRVLQAQNKSRDDHGAEQDLGERGNDCFTQAQKLQVQLAALGEFLEGLECSVDTELKYSPAFLHRAYSDVVEAGVNLPQAILGRLVKRQALAQLEDGSLSGAMSTLDVKADVPVGMKLLKDTPSLEKAGLQNFRGQTVC